MRVLVTGAAGFTGTRMMDFLSGQEGIAVTGLVRKVLPIIRGPRVSYIEGDLLNRDPLIAAVKGIAPDAIIHLGGLTHGPLEDLFQANVRGTKNILDAGYTGNPDCRFLMVSSSAVYGFPGTAPIAESTPLQPLSEYGISKMAQEALAMMHHKLNDSHVCIARPFNLAGPGQSDSFVCGRIVKLAADIEQQKTQSLELQETASSRDIIDVRDVVRGYWALVSRPEFSRDCSGEAFNLGSGNAYPVSQIIALTGQITGRHYKVNLPALSPHIAIPTQKSDNTRITTVTGWKPEISLKTTLTDMLAAAGILI
jgi:nucleoside-diphosphate-sugar epimerase